MSRGIRISRWHEVQDGLMRWLVAVDGSGIAVEEVLNRHCGGRISRWHRVQAGLMRCLVAVGGSCLC